MQSTIEGAPAFAYINVDLEPGETVIADEAYLKESILNPAAKVAEGAVNGEAGMPIYEGVLNEEQIQSLILYARSLGR